jgi:hypothetical protein
VVVPFVGRHHHWRSSQVVFVMVVVCIIGVRVVIVGVGSCVVVVMVGVEGSDS